MKIRIEGGDCLTFCENLSLIFFPGERFPLGDGDGSAREADVTISEKDGAVLSSVLLKDGDRRAHGTGEAAGNGRRDVKLAVGRAFFEAGVKLTGKRPPWGVLSGVRPTKIPFSLYESGFSAGDAEKILTEDYLLTDEKAGLLTEVCATQKEIRKAATEDTCSLYVSIPFCPTRCAYCSFVSYSTPRHLSLIPEYLDALIPEIKRKADAAHANGKKIISVYIGGGTPTVLSAGQLDRLLSAVNEATFADPVSEITVEAGRPDTVSGEKFSVMRAHGVGRTSVNPQILNDDVLRVIGRRHSVDDFYRAFYEAREAGFTTVNTDLIAGLPGSGRELFRETLEKTASIRPENVTVHTFCVKRSSEISDAAKAGAGVEAEAEDVFGTAGSVSDARELFSGEGYLPYYLYRQKNARGNLENVGYSLPGHIGLYNVCIMEELHDIYGAGAGAVSKFRREDGKIVREYNPKYTYEYLDRIKKESEI